MTASPRSWNGKMTDWEKWNVGELIRLNILEVGDGYRAKNAEMGSVGLPFARIANINNGFHFENADLLDEKHLPKVGSKVSKTDDIVFTTKGTVGRFEYVKPDTPKFVYSPQVSYWRVKDKEKIDPRFLFFWMKGREFRDQVHRVKSLTDMADYVNLKDQRKIFLRLPPKTTQHRIASVLCAYEDLIENNTRRVQVLEEIARAIYREWFIEKRFPGYESYPLEGLPKGWQEKKLGEIAELNAHSLRRGNTPEEIQYVDIASVSTGQIDKIEVLPLQKAPGRARRVVQHGDIIWSTVRPNRKSYSLILNPPPNLIVSTGFAVISPKEVPYSFLYQAVTTQEFAAYLSNRAKGSAYPAVSIEDFEQASIMMPPSGLLNSFHIIADDLYQLAHKLREKNHNLRRTRDLLLPKLVSGEIDVPRIGLLNDGD